MDATTGSASSMTERRLQTKPFDRVQSIITSAALLAKLLVSFVVAAYEGWLRKQSAVVNTVKDRSFAPSSLFFFLSAIYGYVSTNKLDPILKTLRLPYVASISWLPKGERSDLPEQVPEPSVYVEILHDPAPAQIRADVIFIHGLHGSVVHTWKQGMWHYRKQVQNESLPHAILGPDHCPAVNNNDCDVATPETPDSAIEMGPDTSSQDSTPDADHDVILEHITDIINSIDDTRRDSGVEETDCGSEPYSPCWPRDWLPRDCPGIRILALNYTTDPFLWRPLWITKRIRSGMKQRTCEMIEHLIQLGVGQHPIVWVGHSKGGLYVKQMLVNARDAEDQRLRRFLTQTRGIMFYSVPHRGSSLAHLNLPLLRQSIELTEVKKDCHEVLALHKEFMKLYEEKHLTADIFSYVETILTFMFITNVRVVSVDSADLGFGSFQGVNIDHREICKPLSRNCFLYKELANLINRVV